MIGLLNSIVEAVETRIDADPDVSALSRSAGTTEYHARRMFSALAGMPLSEYIRRRRMTVAVQDLRGSAPLLEIAVRYGYGSTEAFTRAFRAVHGVTPREVRHDSVPCRMQPQLRFRLTVEGNTPMDTRITDSPAFRLIGHAARVPLQYEGVNPHIQAHVGAIAPAEHARLKALSATEPHGLLQITDDIDPDAAEGTPLTYMHGVAVPAGTNAPNLDVIDVAAGTWAVFRTSGPYPASLQATWAATATDWFPSNPWVLRPGPSIVAVLDRDDAFTTATCELWMPIEPAAR